MYYWYNENSDSIEGDCGLVMSILLKDDELNENNIRELIREMEYRIYTDYRKKWTGISDIPMTKRRTNMSRGKKSRGLRDMDFNAISRNHSLTNPNTIFHNCNIVSERIQAIMKKKGKVTWGDVYVPWLESRDPFEKQIVCTG